jgi:hypothetical protein
MKNPGRLHVIVFFTVFLLLAWAAAVTAAENSAITLSVPSSATRGSSVTVSGVLTSSGSGVNGAPVGITVKDTNSSVYFVDQVTTTTGGNFSTSFGLKNDASTGSWTVSAAGHGAAASTSIQVNSSSSGGGGGGSTPTSTTSTPAATPATTPTNEGVGSLSITASSGGAVKSADGMISVTVPVNALSGNATLKVEEVADTAKPPLGSFMSGGKVYEITLSEGSIKSGSSVNLTFDYTLSGANEEQVNAYYWSGSKWVCLGGRVLNGKLEVNVNHFTKFAVMADTSLPVLNDVKSHWAYNDIKRLVGMKVASGYPGNSYKPDSNITRAEFAVLLAKAQGWQAKSNSLGFADADTIPDWAKGFIATAIEKGVIGGYEDKTFRAEQQISRVEIAVMLVRTMGKQDDSPEKDSISFNDSGTIGDWAKSSVAVAVKHGIVKGKPGNVFAPADNATRAESATMVVRLLNSQGI